MAEGEGIFLVNVFKREVSCDLAEIEANIFDDTAEVHIGFVYCEPDNCVDEGQQK